MSVQNSSRSAIIINTVKGKIASILGYIIVILLGLPFIFNAYEDTATNITVFILIGLGIWLIVYGSKTKRRIKRFKKYIGVISHENQTSLENIASTNSQSVDFVRKDIEKMINKKFFVNAHIDENMNEIILQNRNKTFTYTTNTFINEDVKPEMVVITCKGCGAKNSVQKGLTSECEYCGSNIQA